MVFAEDKFMEYLRENLGRIEHIKINELLVHVTGCLSLTAVEKLEAYVRNQGNRPSVLPFYLELSRCDDWVEHFINALRKAGHRKLAEEFEEVYSNYQLPASRWSSSQPLPPSLNHYNRQLPQVNPQHSSSLPGQISPASLDTRSGPSQSFNQIQPGHETSRTSPSQQSQEFRSLPPFRPDPPALPGTQLSRNVSAPILSGGQTLEEDTPRNPIPESTPYQTAPSEDDVKALQQQESSISENPHIAPDPLPNGSLSPSMKPPQPEVPTQPSSEDVSPAKVPETRTAPSYSLSISSERGADNRRGQPVRDETEKLPEQDPSNLTVGQKDHGGKRQQREQSVIHKAANPPEQPVSAPRDPSVRRKVVASGQRNGESACQAVEDVPDSRPGRYHPVNRETAQEELSREGPANSRVLPGSSCKPFDNNNDFDEDTFSKPGVLMSTEGFGDATDEGEVSSVMSYNVELEISDCTESNESSNVSHRSSALMTQDKCPPVSTPNSRSVQINNSSPEENDFSFDLTSSPHRHRPLDSSSKQPEENSFRSTEVSHYIHFKEEHEEDLMGGNDDILRNRLKKSPSTIEPNDERTQQKYSDKAEGRDRERIVLITVTVASVCLSLYILWKSRQN